LAIIGPFIQPLDYALERANIAGPSATALDVSDLTPQQISTLADIEALIYHSVANLTTKAQPNVTSSAAVPDADPSDTNAESDGLTLETRGLLDLASLLVGLPIIGPLLTPLVPLLTAIGLGASSIASVDDVKSITLDQATTLARLELNLANAVNNMDIRVPSDAVTSTTTVSPAESTQL
jgi:hypothetical protein